MDEPRVIAPNNLNTVLRWRGLTTRNAAEMSGASADHIARLRAGRTRPSGSLARLLALALGVPEEFLFPTRGAKEADRNSLDPDERVDVQTAEVPRLPVAYRSPGEDADTAVDPAVDGNDTRGAG